YWDEPKFTALIGQRLATVRRSAAAANARMQASRSEMNANPPHARSAITACSNGLPSFRNSAATPPRSPIAMTTARMAAATVAPRGERGNVLMEASLMLNFEVVSGVAGTDFAAGEAIQSLSGH